jgi:hypothetical protein
MISFRKYPGRSEEERTAHMKRIAGMVGKMLAAFIKSEGKST